VLYDAGVAKVFHPGADRDKIVNDIGSLANSGHSILAPSQ
jgi:hypothetical protein